MSVFNELWGLIKPLIGIEEGQSIPKWAVKAGMKQAAKLTPNLSKTILYGKKNTRSELGKAFFELLTKNDEPGKQFRASFSDALKLVNYKTNALIDEKSKISAELGRQEQHKEDEIGKMSTAQANDMVEDLIDATVAEVEKKQKITKSNKGDNNGE